MKKKGRPFPAPSEQTGEKIEIVGGDEPERDPLELGDRRDGVDPVDMPETAFGHAVFVKKIDDRTADLFPPDRGKVEERDGLRPRMLVRETFRRVEREFQPGRLPVDQFLEIAVRPLVVLGERVAEPLRQRPCVGIDVAVIVFAPDVTCRSLRDIIIFDAVELRYRPKIVVCRILPEYIPG